MMLRYKDSSTITKNQDSIDEINETKAISSINININSRKGGGSRNQ